MAYTTAADLLRFGATSLAQLCTQYAGETIDAALLKAVLLDADVSGFDANDVTVVAEAVQWLSNAVADAEKLADSYLESTCTLPLPQSTIDQSPIAMHVETLAFHALHVNGADESLEKRYQSSIAWLRDVSKGLVSLGQNDDAASKTGSRRLTGVAPGSVDWSDY